MKIENIFKWHDSRWMPTKLEDKIWVISGCESVKEYLEKKILHNTPKEIALELDTAVINIHHLLADHDISVKDTVWYKTDRCAFANHNSGYSLTRKKGGGYWSKK